MPDGFFDIDGESLAVWPEGLEVKAIDAQRTIQKTRFADTGATHPAFRRALEAELAKPESRRQYGRSMGGTKLYRLENWDNPAARLLTARALALFKAATGAESAAVDMAWVNVYGQGDYIVPHSHWRSEGSVVYMLDEGEEDPADHCSGLFSFNDPRLPLCCQIEPGLMTNPIYPTMKAGGMLVFPSALVHSVHPYGGKRPRITLAWNINRQALEGDTLSLLNQKAAKA